jgi:hypothetical protein
LGVPLSDASWIPGHGPGESRLARLGTQWVRLENPISPTAYGINPPQSRVLTPFAVGQGSLTLAAMPMGPPTQGWIRVGNQYAYYKGTVGNANTDGWQVIFPNPATDGPVPYGRFTVPIAAAETVEWVECVLNLQSHGLTWSGFINPAPGDPTIRAHAVSTPLVTLARAETTNDKWPPLEGFVQDGRYSYAGAQARAEADLAAFKDPLISVEWSTDDLNALPGRSQAIALSSEAVTPPMNTTVTILQVEMTFPLRTLPPRRACKGGRVKPSSFLDLVVTTND